jgi:DNA-binding transcriptional ArsR family regulator
VSATPRPDTCPAAPADAPADLLARVFHGLADPTRLRIVQLLLAGEKNVGELVAALGAPQGRVSSHLMCLRWCGFVATRRAGKFVYYRVADPRVADLVWLAQTLLVDNAQAIASCAVIAREG